MPEIEVIEADITSLRVDAIVDAANETYWAVAGESERLGDALKRIARTLERRRQDAEGRVAGRAMDREPSNDSTPPENSNVPDRSHRS